MFVLSFLSIGSPSFLAYRLQRARFLLFLLIDDLEGFTADLWSCQVSLLLLLSLELLPGILQSSSMAASSTFALCITMMRTSQSVEPFQTSQYQLPLLLLLKLFMYRGQLGIEKVASDKLLIELKLVCIDVLPYKVGTKRNALFFRDKH